jgi:voltage-gated potassium channel
MINGGAYRQPSTGLRPSVGAAWRKRLFIIIFESRTFGGKLFDVVLIVSILLSVVVVMLASIKDLWATYAVPLTVGWWVFTIIFTIEYILRILCVRKPHRYILSFFGIVDLLAILPAYLGLFFRSGRFLSVVRILRVLRVFRILDLNAYASEAQNMLTALKNSQRRITIFFIFIITLTVILGSVMYVIEADQPNGGFSSIPHSIYWAVVTITTVGYGDISPQTGLGQFIAALAMIMGYSIIVVPTGLVSVEFARMKRSKEAHSRDCASCRATDHDEDALFCKHCGVRL